ncbi:MAG: hypothetical protein ABI165_11270 [Bryobacteraceae bacterium]
MAKTDFKSVDEYIASQPGAVPGAEEAISHPATDRVIAAFRDDLAPYKVNKGTIRFPLSESVPVKLIERIAKFRAKEVAEREKAKAAAPKKP